MKILVTGAHGFIGSYVCRDLLERGIAVRGLKRAGSDLTRIADVATRIEWVTCDLLTAAPAELDAAAKGVDGCLHLAWDVTPGRYLTSPGNAHYREASLRLFEQLAERGCRRITGAGTCFEYAPANGPLAESAALDPITPYAREKLATYTEAERRLRGSTTALAWARLFYLYGPGESPRRLVPDVIAGLLKHERVATTAGTQVRDFLHVADVARALTAVALSPLQGAVNLGSGDPIRVLDIVETIAAITGRRDLIDVGARPENLVDPPYVSADNRRLVEETGWRPHYTLAAGLADTVEWWRRTLTPLPAGERIVPPDLGPLDR